MDTEAAVTPVDAQVRIGEGIWGVEDLVQSLAGRTLRVPEVLLLVRYREALSGRVLELGSGGGRLSGYLLDIAQEFHGLDISPLMVAHCERTYPGGTFEVGNLRDLSGYPDGSLDVVFASFNVLDVLDDAERRRVIVDTHRILDRDGLLMMSSHNLAHEPLIPKPTSLRTRNPLRVLRQLPRLPIRARNHRRLLPLQRHERDYAILTDEFSDYSLLHYYVDRDAQERQLAEAGFELLSCIDLDGREVRAGEQAPLHPELHYVARRREVGAAA